MSILQIVRLETHKTKQIIWRNIWRSRKTRLLALKNMQPLAIIMLCISKEKLKRWKGEKQFSKWGLSLETICLQKYEITTKYDPTRCYNWIALQIYKKLEITEIFLV